MIVSDLCDHHYLNLLTIYLKEFIIINVLIVNLILIILKTKNEKLILECYNCKQRYRKKFNKELIKRFASTYKFCNNDLNKFVLLIRKGVYPYEYADTWERFSEISLPNKEDFYSNLNMEDISDIDYRHANNVLKVFKLENLGNYHDLYVQSDTLLLADVFNNFSRYVY